jgi:hypothetical protein
MAMCTKILNLKIPAIPTLTFMLLLFIVQLNRAFAGDAVLLISEPATLQALEKRGLAFSEVVGRSGSTRLNTQPRFISVKAHASC